MQKRRGIPILLTTCLIESFGRQIRLILYGVQSLQYKYQYARRKKNNLFFVSLKTFFAVSFSTVLVKIYFDYATNATNFKNIFQKVVKRLLV